ncbi:MAG: type II toxin-antitoxin system RelE/ParE family toxin [Candidatus Heimdallarchaeota archaeon]|nr:type II toxin-antitoxin system RelE/ParE family toxin [Candidatus Heimdallarchaeota archaeon]
MSQENTILSRKCFTTSRIGPYRILFTSYAKKKVDKLPSDVKDRIEGALLRIQVRPFDYVERLVNHPYYKLRVGDYRLIMEIIEEDIVILVVEVGHRRNIYKKI